MLRTTLFWSSSKFQHSTALHVAELQRFARLCSRVVQTTPFARLSLSEVLSTPPHRHPHTHTATDVQPTAHLPPRPCPQHGCPCTTPAASHLCAYTPHRRHALRTHTATGVAATLRHTPRLRHTTRAPQAWRAVSHPLPHTRGVPFDCDPRTLPHAPQNSNFPNAKLTKARTTPGPLPHSTHDAPPRTHRELSQVLCTTHHSNRCKDHNMRCSSTSR